MFDTNIPSLFRNIFVLDFETTGLDPTTAHPIEIGYTGQTASGDTISNEMLIKPPISIPPETSAVHHITDADVEYAPDWATARSIFMDDVFSYGNGRIPVFVAHNSDYEKAILEQRIEGLPQFPDVLWVCTYKCSLRVWPDAPSHKNEALRYWLGLSAPGIELGRNSNQRPHSALHDARVTCLLLQKLLEHANMDELIEWSELPAKLPKMPMGKHFGQAWDTIPYGYLTWCISQADMRPDVVFCCKEELERRKNNANARSG